MPIWIIGTTSEKNSLPCLPFTSNTYQMKREILTFSNKISKYLFKPDKKFSADMTYGMLAAGSCLFCNETWCSSLWRSNLAMDRGYDDNKMFLKLDELEQDYVIRLTAKRKLFFHGKWVPATQLRNQRKGKIKTVLTYKGKKHDA